MITRRDVTANLALFLSTYAVASPASATSTKDENGISRNCECIHQEVAFSASPSTLYSALVDPKQFGKATESIMPGASASTMISPHVGAEFSMFKGIIVGRHVEMVPGQRLVQAWREKDWDPGVYSIVRFQLNPAGSGTNLVFDHTGFPQGAADHLAIGWKSHYWEPLQKYLSSK